ncbi:MAG: hypothetical protein CFE22_02620 [Cytophagaceae bacterium BCCC1]|nr:MAG: hypothetical protein CFE22_02620 [Cytophagaceae bacterium BCCC1]
MKKLYLLLIIATLSISCEKPAEEVAEIETLCQIQKISYDDGHYELYKFDGNNRLVETIFTYDDEGKITEFPVKHEYNASGNLSKSTDSYGWTQESIYDANGVITRMDFKDEKGELYEQYSITLDSKKRITKLVSKIEAIECTYEYNDPSGGLSKSEVKWQGKILDQYNVSSYETDKTKKSYDIVIKGHLFNPAQFTQDIIYDIPLNFKSDNLMAVKGKASTQYNEDWSTLTDKLRLYYDYTATRKFNSNNFVIQRASADAIENKTYIKTFAYSNCN